LSEEMGWVRRAPDLGEVAVGTELQSISVAMRFEARTSSSPTVYSSWISWTNSNALTNAPFSLYETSVSFNTALVFTAPNLDARDLAKYAGTLVSPSLRSALRGLERRGTVG